MNKLNALVDFENVQPTLDELAKLAPGFTDIWLFHGPHQANQALQLAAVDNRVILVPRSGRGPNALDFHLSFHLGFMAAKHPDSQLVVVANDKGYDPMLAHVRMLGFAAKRVGHKAKPSAAGRLAAKKAAPVSTSASAKKAIPVKAPAPAKKATATTVAKQPPPKKAPIKKAPAEKTVRVKVPALKVAARPKASAPLEPKEFTRIKNGLAKMGDKAPHKLNSFLRHLKSLLGKDSTAEQIEAVVQKLEQANVVRVAGDLVLYGQR
jgi:PIN domain